MTDPAFMAVVFSVATGVWGLHRLVPALRVRRSLAGHRIVTCPETGRAAAVRFETAHAAMTALVTHDPELQLAHCSRWTTRGPCDQPCIADAQAPECETTRIVARWAEGKRCVFCRKPIADAPRLGHHVALLAHDGVTIEWPTVPPEALPEALGSLAPVCWDCHVTETFRRLRPELVTDR
jgi:hypothetical protein